MSDQHVGQIEREAKIIPKMLGTRIAVRLEKHQQAIELAAASGFERGADFRRVMPIIVDHRDVVHHAFNIEAAADASEIRRALRGLVRREHSDISATAAAAAALRTL